MFKWVDGRLEGVLEGDTVSEHNTDTIYTRPKTLYMDIYYRICDLCFIQCVDCVRIMLAPINTTVKHLQILHILH